jgi:hypothetical protein
MTSGTHTGRSSRTRTTTSSGLRRVAALLALLGSLVLLAGCGGGGSSQTAHAGASGPTAAAATGSSKGTAGTTASQAAPGGSEATPTTPSQPTSSSSSQATGPQLAHETVADFAHAMGAREFERACSLMTPDANARVMSAEPHAKSCAEAISDAYAELEREEKSSHEQSGFSPSDYVDAKIEEEEGEHFTLTAPNGQKRPLSVVWENGRGPWRISTDEEGE